MMAGRGSAVDWESIARGMVDGTSAFDLVNFPATNTDNYQYYRRAGLGSVVIDDSVTSIGERCFGNCTNLTSVVLPSNLTSIGFGAFDSCTNLRNLTIPSLVTSIANYAFSSCRQLERIICEPTIPPTLAGGSTFSNTNNCPIYVPDSAVNDYKAANRWSDLASRIFPISDMPTT